MLAKGKTAIEGSRAKAAGGCRAYQAPPPAISSARRPPIAAADQ